MNEGGSSARSDLIGGAGWVAFGLLIVVESLRMERFTNMGATLYTMPGFVPGLIGSAITVLGLLLALRGWKRGQTAAAQQGEPAPLLNQRVAITIPLMLAYAGGLLGRAPFWLATALFVAAFTWTFAPPDQPRRRRAIAATLAGVLTAAIVMTVFQEVFLVRLP